MELSKSEDNVVSLAAGRKGKSASNIVYAGVNSGPEDQKNGKNEHFRVLEVGQPSKTKAAIPPRISEVSRHALFTPRDVDTYQRVIRLSPQYEGTTQVGAVATGLTKTAQIVLFELGASGSGAPKPRGKLELNKEANDLDLNQTGPDTYRIAYCDDYEIFLMNLSKGTGDEPQCIYTIPHEDTSGFNGRPSFRALRWLTPNFLFTAGNLPRRSGAILNGFRLIDGKARLSVSARLPKPLQQITALSVRNLSPGSTPSPKAGDSQFVIAASGPTTTGEHAIYLYTLDHQSVGEVDLLANLLPFATLKNTHEMQITSLSFSYFHPPAKTTSRMQYLRLASISTNKTAIVHHIPLRKHIDKSAPIRRGGPPRQPRYIVALPSNGASLTNMLLIIAAGIAIIAIVSQSLLELKGLTPSVVGARKIAPASWVSDMKVPEHSSLLTEAISQQLELGGDGAARVVLRENAEAGEHGLELGTDHDEDVHGPAAKWEDLPPAQQKAWKRKLKDAGQWTEQQGETIFKGILFSELAGVVGAMMG